MRSVVLLAVGLGTLTGAARPAAPVPKGPSEAERIEKLFGKPVDPDKDCKFKLAGDKLTITVPDKVHDFQLDNFAERFDAPRTERVVKAGFTARVRVVCRLPDAAAVPVVGQKNTSYAAGLVAWQDGKNYATLLAERSTEAVPGVMTGRVSGRSAGGCSIVDGKADPTTTMWLRLTCDAKATWFAYSYDGAVWQSGGGVIRPLTGDVRIGVVAGHTGTAGFTATFEDFVIEPLTDPKK